MARKKWTEHYFSTRLRTERDNREWTLPQMSQMLADKGIHVHHTSLAKIEKGTRSVRIDEAAGIADLFEVSVDALLGRNVERGADLAYTLRAVLTTARQSAQQTASVADALDAASADLDALEFNGRDTLDKGLARARRGLRDAHAALSSVAEFTLPARSRVRLRKDLAIPETRTVVVGPKESGR
jgi:transcriptional regulator with XRE-family HTH domain